MVVLTQEMKDTFTEACETLAGMGGFVHRDLYPSHFPESFQFSADGDEPDGDGLCLMSMIDPSKATVPNAVQCRSAAIKISIDGCANR